MTNKYHVINVSGTIASGGTPQTLLPPNAFRKYLVVQNPTTAIAVLRVSFDATATTTNSIELTPGGVWSTAPMVALFRWAWCRFWRQPRDMRSSQCGADNDLKPSTSACI